jgi:hypothetical protein
MVMPSTRLLYVTLRNSITPRLRASYTLSVERFWAICLA